MEVKRSDGQIDWASLATISKNQVELGRFVLGRSLSELEKTRHFIKKIRLGLSDSGVVINENDPDPLSLYGERTDIGVYDTTNHTIYSLHLPRIFWGDQMVTLLRLSRPPRPEYAPNIIQDRPAIQADWIIADRMNESRYLRFIHSLALGHHWAEFTTHHVKRFMNAVGALSKKETKNVLVENAASSSWRDRYIIEVNNAPEDYALFEPEGLYPAYQVDQVYPGNYDTSRPCTEDGIVSKSITKTKGFKNFKIFYQDSWAQFEINPERVSRKNSIWVDNKRKEKMTLKVVDEVIKDPKSYGLSPWILIAYPKDGGRPVYIRSNEPPSLREEVGESADTILGLLMATHLSSDVRNQLPYELRLKLRFFGGKFSLPLSLVTQVMREAQMPLVVSMFDYKIIRGLFVTNLKNSAEEMAGLNIAAYVA